MKDKFNRISKCLFWVLHCLHTHTVLGLMGHVNFPEYLCFQIIYSLPGRNLGKNITCFFLLQKPGGNFMPCLVCVLSQHRNPEILLLWVANHPRWAPGTKGQFHQSPTRWRQRVYWTLQDVDDVILTWVSDTPPKQLHHCQIPPHHGW